MKEPSIQQISICIDLKKYRIRLHKKALQAIGMPPYVLLLVNPTERTLVIQSTNHTDRKGHHLSWAAAKNKSSFEIYSRELICKLRELCGEWKEDCSYRMYGQTAGNGSALIFNMDSFMRMET